MNSASLELCKTLFELSGWDSTDKHWYRHYGDTDNTFDVTEQTMGVYCSNKREADYRGWVARRPAYDSGFLLRKLPQFVSVGQMISSDAPWVATCSKFHPNKHPFCSAATPEDALCQLAISLFKAGILTKEEQK